MRLNFTLTGEWPTNDHIGILWNCSNVLCEIMQRRPFWGDGICLYHLYHISSSFKDDRW